MSRAPRDRSAPGTRATRLVRPGRLSRISGSSPTSDSLAATYSAATRSPAHVDWSPVLVVSMRIRSRHSSTTSELASAAVEVMPSSYQPGTTTAAAGLSPVETVDVGLLGEDLLSGRVGVEVVPDGDLRQGERVVEHGAVVVRAVRAVRGAGVGELGVEVNDALAYPGAAGLVRRRGGHRAGQQRLADPEQSPDPERGPGSLAA